MLFQKIVAVLAIIIVLVVPALAVEAPPNGAQQEKVGTPTYKGT